MHLSHLNEDLERWWKEVAFTDQLRAMTRPGLTVPDKTYTIAEDVTRVERAADVRADLARFGAVGHSATLQTVTRLQANTRDAYGVVRPRGTAIVQRADFNTLDNSFAQSSVAAEVAGDSGCGSALRRVRAVVGSLQPRAARDGRLTRRRQRRCRSTRARTSRGSTRSFTQHTARTSSRRRGRTARSRSSDAAQQVRVTLTVPLQDRLSSQWSAVR